MGVGAICNLWFYFGKCLWGEISVHESNLSNRRWRWPCGLGSSQVMSPVQVRLGAGPPREVPSSLPLQKGLTSRCANISRSARVEGVVVYRVLRSWLHFFDEAFPGSSGAVVPCASQRTAPPHQGAYISTSLIRNRTPLGPYRRPMPRILGGS